MSSLLLALAVCAPCWAQQSDAAHEALAKDSPTGAMPPEGARLLPANTVVELEITEAISSGTHKRGDRFGLRLHAPVIVDGTVALPAGIPGTGEIVHADRARGGGKPGELILAARYLEDAGTRIPLHGFRLVANGKDHTNVALATAVALGPFAQFIHGGEVEIPVATVAQARLTNDVALPGTTVLPLSDTLPSDTASGLPVAGTRTHVPTPVPDPLPNPTTSTTTPLEE